MDILDTCQFNVNTNEEVEEEIEEDAQNSPDEDFVDIETFIGEENRHRF